MKNLHYLLVLFALLLGSPCGFAQKSDRKNKTSESRHITEGGKKEALKKVAGDFDLDHRAEQESLRMARLYGIENPGRQNQLFKACRKYLKALKLLEKDYGENTSDGGVRPNTEVGVRASQAKKRGRSFEDYHTRKQQLDSEYGRELRKILPES